MKRRPIVKTEMWYNLTKEIAWVVFCSRKSNRSEASRGEEHQEKTGEMLTTVERRGERLGVHNSLDNYYFG